MPADRVTQSRCAILATLHLQAKDDAMSESVIAELEGQLQKAMLASDVDVLDARGTSLADSAVRLGSGK